jgi:hypothetical protein
MLFQFSLEGPEIRRIQARSTLALALLLGTWLLIFAFVLAAMWLKWDL